MTDEELKHLPTIMAWDFAADRSLSVGVRWLAAHSGDVIEKMEDPVGFVARSVEADHAVWRDRAERVQKTLHAILDELVRQGDWTPAIRDIVAKHNCDSKAAER